MDLCCYCGIELSKGRIYCKKSSSYMIRDCLLVQSLFIAGINLLKLLHIIYISTWHKLTKKEMFWWKFILPKTISFKINKYLHFLRIYIYICEGSQEFEQLNGIEYDFWPSESVRWNQFLETFLLKNTAETTNRWTLFGYRLNRKWKMKTILKVLQ